LIATLAGWALLHAWVVEVNYWHWSYGPIALKRLLHFPLVQVLLACFGAFGPLAIGLFFRLRALRQVFQKDLSYTVYFLLALLLVILAGGEERYLFYWLSPLVLAALGVAWAAPGHLFQKAPLFALALSAQ